MELGGMRPPTDDPEELWRRLNETQQQQAAAEVTAKLVATLDGADPGRKLWRRPMLAPAAGEVWEALFIHKGEPQIVIEEDGRAERLRRKYGVIDSSGGIKTVFIDVIDIPDRPFIVEVDMTEADWGYYRIEKGKLKARKPGTQDKFRRVNPFGLRYQLFCHRMQVLRPVIKRQT